MKVFIFCAVVILLLVHLIFSIRLISQHKVKQCSVPSSPLQHYSWYKFSYLILIV